MVLAIVVMLLAVAGLMMVLLSSCDAERAAGEQKQLPMANEDDKTKEGSEG